MSLWMKWWEPWQTLLETFPTLAWIWIGMLGACFGSFLNVVVYRLPAGKSLSRPGSHCPRCGHAIRWHDNIPILGWIWLRGRCRDCHATIAARYPLVELLVALLFAWQWHQQVIAPDAPIASAGPSPVALVGFLWHVSWFTPLLAVALIEADGKRIPCRLLVFTGLLAALLAGIWPRAVPHRTGHGPLFIELVWSAILGALVVGAMEIAVRAYQRWPRSPKPSAARADSDWKRRLAVGSLAAIYLGTRTALPALVLATLTERIMGDRVVESAGNETPRWRWTATLLLLSAIWPLLSQFR